MSNNISKKSKESLINPWGVTPYEVADISAIQALERGDATPEQQRRAIKWIVETACGTYDLSFRPGDDGRRNTDFAEGKRHVGLNIVKMLRLNVSLLRRKNNET